MSFCLVFLFLISIVPVSALAVNSAIAAAEDDVIASFEEPVTQVAGSIGTEASDLPFPASLVANMEDGSSRSIPVVWDDGGFYDENAAGVYTFTADVGTYTYTQPHPVVVVTLSESENTQSSDGIILSFDELDAMYAEKLAVALGIDLADLSLPNELGAMVERDGLPASENIAVTWVSDPDYDSSVIGGYLLTPVLADGYTLADGVNLPQITIEVKDTNGLIQPFAAITLDITGKTEAQIQSAIASALNSYNPIVVTGTKTNVTASINLTIPAGKTVTWNATYESTASYTGEIIRFSGLSGTFQVASQGNIVSKGTGINISGTSSGCIEINGGQISAQQGFAIYSNGPRIMITGGRVFSQNSQTIFAVFASNSSQITVSGGTVHSASSMAINVIGANSQITVGGTGVVSSDGSNAIGSTGNIEIKENATVKASGNGATINSTGASASVTVKDNAVVENSGSGHGIGISGAAAKLTVSGGKVLAKEGYALYCNNGGRIEVSGGLAFAYGSGITGPGNVVHSSGTFAVTGQGVVIGWDAAQGVRKYPEYQKTHITLMTASAAVGTAEAYWDYGSSPAEFTDGITYQNGFNKGFIELPVEIINTNTVLVTVSKEISGTYANMQELFDFKLIFTDAAGAPVVTAPTFYYTGGTLAETGASAPEDGSITLGGDGSATIRLGHGQKIALEIPCGCHLEIQEILETGSLYTPSIQLTIGSVETDLSGNTTERQEMNEDATVAYANAFEAIVPTDITPGVEARLILLFSAVLLGFAIALPTIIRRSRRG